MLAPTIEYGVTRPTRKRNAIDLAATICLLSSLLILATSCHQPSENPPPSPLGNEQDPPCDRESDATYVRTSSFTSTPLFWSRETVAGCIPLSLDPQASSDLSVAQARQSLLDAAQQWSEASGSCSGPLCFRSGADVSRAVGLGFDPETENHNILTFAKIEEWDHPTSAIALTTTTVAARTGEILDADIDINDGHFSFTLLSPPPSGTISLQTVLTHELGHLLGFDHNASSQSIMFPTEEGGSDGRLSQDDIDGVCETFDCH